MPNKCCVPNCIANRKNGPKVSYFRFPKLEILRNKWIAAIPRSNFNCSEHSRVCELHFTSDDIEKETSFLCERSGRCVMAPLLYPRIKSDVVPSQFSEYLCFSKSKENTKENFKRKKLHTKTQKIKEVSPKSLKMDLQIQHEIERQFFTLDELHSELSSLNLQHWEVLRKETCTYLFYFVDVVYPCAKCFLKITKDLQVSLFYKNTNISSLSNSNVTFPLNVNTLNKLEKLLKDVKSFVDCDFHVIAMDEKIRLINDLFVSLTSQIPDNEVIFAIQGKWLKQVS